jgi:hypothetical protein
LGTRQHEAHIQVPLSSARMEKPTVNCDRNPYFVLETLQVAWGRIAADVRGKGVKFRATLPRIETLRCGYPPEGHGEGFPRAKFLVYVGVDGHSSKAQLSWFEEGRPGVGIGCLFPSSWTASVWGIVPSKLRWWIQKVRGTWAGVLVHLAT